MQRYRVNLPLLIGIVVGSIVLAGGSYGLYSYQKSQNASRLLDRAEQARSEGDLEQSSKLLIDYLRIKTGDEDAMARLAVTLAEIADTPNAEPRDIRNAIGQLEATVREFPAREDLRRRLVDLYMSRRVRMLKPALDHVSQLLNRKPGDPELEGLLSECYFAAADPKAVPQAFKLIGYDPTTEEFNESEALAPHNTGVYGRLAVALKNEQSDEKLASRVIDRMIEANPESGEAYLAKAQWLEVSNKEDEALPFVEKALELAPDDPAIVIANARLYARDEKYDRAKSLIDKALETNPEEPGLYQTLSDIAIRQNDLAGAIEACEHGIAAVPVEQSLMLMWQKARLQLQGDSPEVTKATITKMREGEMLPSAYPDYLEARLAMGEGNWLEAIQTFEKYQSFFANNTSMGVEVNVMLALCREKLGQDELALEAFNQALLIDPKNTMADLGRKRVMQSMGRAGRADEGVSIYTALAEELAKPKQRQDWEGFDRKCVEYIERMQLGDAMLDVLRAEVLMRRGEYPEARKLLIGSYKKDPENLGVRRAAVKLFAADPDQGPAKALGLLDKVIKDFGDLPILRLEKADLLTLINDENLTDQLFALGEGTEDWNDDQKVQLWKGLAEKFGRLRNEEARAESLRKVAELSPGDLPTLLDMFKVSLAANDTAGIQEAQDAILKVVGSKEDATWQFTEASRLLAEWRAAGGKGDGVKQSLEIVNRALSGRRDWNELHNLKADIAVAQGDIRGALESYDRAASLGRQDARSLFQYIKLLRARGRFADAIQQMEKIGREGRLQLLGSDYAESLLKVGRTAEAIEAAQAFALEAPNNAAVQLWYGRFLTQSSGEESEKDHQAELLERAGVAFNNAVELDPSSADAWLALVGYYAATRKAIEADDTIRKAQLALVEDQNQLLFARCYEMVGRGIDAEALYQLALDGAEKSDRARVAHLLAQFYLGGSYRRDDAIAKATPLINQILKDAAEGTITDSDPNARWAKSTAAKLLARSGAYQDLLNAEHLIASNSDKGVLPVEDRLLMAEILAPRPEPVSRLKAVGLLEDLGQNQRLSKKSELDLGRLYYALGEWRKCREQMLDVIAKNPNDSDVRLAYLEMLLQRGGPSDIDTAVQHVQRLQDIAPKELSTREMLARVAFEKGKKREATAALMSMLPRSASEIKAEQVPLINRIAMRLVGFEDYAQAQKLLELSAKLGGVNEKFVLAQFLGEHVDGDQGLDALEKLRDDISPAQQIQGGLAILRGIEANGKEIPAEDFKRVTGWLDRALLEDPDLVPLRLQQAELFDLARDYDKAATAYRGLLDRKDLRGVSRAVVLNNLAYLLALAKADKESVSEADRYLREAVDILGPGTEILDTRAVIAIADSRYKDAIEDLRLAVIDRPTASKYFHLATAYALSGDGDAARKAWQEALDRGLTRESVSRLEREQFDNIQRRIGGEALTKISS